MPRNSTRKNKKRMPTWFKRFLLTFGVLILLGGSYLIYEFKFKEYDTADNQVTEITRETFKIELPDGLTIELDEDGKIVESDSTKDSMVVYNGTDELEPSSASKDDVASTVTPTGSPSQSNEGTSPSNEETSSSNSQNSTGTDATSSNSGTSNSESTGSDVADKSTAMPSNTKDHITVASIKGKYQPVMSSLQGQASSKIDALVGRAISEYMEKQANGESINYGYFYNKYTNAANELEARTDKVFYQVIAIIEKDLVKNGFSKTHADSFSKEYEEIKKSRKDTLLQKAIGN